MSARKCCCCGLLSCFPCFSDKKSTLSAQPDSSEIAPPPRTVITNPSPAATLTVESSHQLSSSAPSSAAAPSQVNASTVMQNDSQPIAPSDAVPSSSPGIVTPSALIPTTSQTTASPPIQPPSSSTPSSLIPATSQTTASPPTQPPSSSTASSLIPATSQTTASPPTQPPSSSTASSLIPATSQTTASPPTQPPSSSTPSSLTAATSQTTASPPTQQPSSSTPSSLIPATSQTTASPLTQPPSSSTPSSLIPATAPPTQPPSSSIPSSSRLPKESDYAETILDAAIKLDKGNVDVDFSDLINYISRLFDSIEEKEKEKEQKKGNSPSKPMATRNYWPGSKFFSKLKEVVAEGIEGIKDLPTGDAKTIALDLVKRVGMGHLVTSGFLVVANILERYEAISTNKGTCLSLLKEMDKLARHVNELRKRPELKESMVDSIREAIALIVEASLACCTQINATKISKFFSTTVNGEELAKFKTRLAETDTHMQRNFNLCLYDAIVRRQKPMELQYPEHPKNTVGIEKQLEKVIELLECGNDKNAVAVILHGFGGMGKTTLADAVFAGLLNAKIEGYKYSCVRLFDDIASPPNIVELQKFIIKALKMGEEPKEFQRYEEGQRQIESILAKEVVLIYIDNVLLPDKPEGGPDALTRLLPTNMANAKKLRLLITTRNKDAVSWMTMSKGVEKKFYPIQSLPEAEAEALLKKELNGNEIQLNASQIDGIVKICGGVPALLKVLAGFINDDGEGNAVQNYEKLKKEAEEKKWEGAIGERIEQYVFAYDKLEDKLKDPFLDICSYFRGWDWKKLSDIVGETELERLEKRALVTRDVKSMTARVHDVILTIGLQRTEGNRFRLTTATEIEKFSRIRDKNLQKIKGIWASDNKDPLRIPASKLDLMSGSLRVLKFGPLTDVEGKCEKEFEELVFFSARTSHLPFYVSKLEGFEKLRHLCYKPADLQNLSQMPSNLRHVDIELNSPAFQVSSNCMQRLRNLRVLRLSNAQFKSLPQELGDMGNGLEEVSISGCQHLEELSISGCQYQELSISGCQHLEELSISGCQYLEEVSISGCQYLEEVSISGCKYLKKVSISTLKSLRVLIMGGCSGLTQLPKGLGSLTSLQELYLTDCTSLEAFPSELENLTSISTLKSLRVLRMYGCSGLKQLPKGLGSLTSLQELYLKGCKNLEALPSELENLTSLQKLDLSLCESLKALPSNLGKLRSLQELKLSGCASLQALPISLEELSSLRLLNLALCRGIKDLPRGLEKLTSLVELRLFCCGLSSIPENIGMLKLNSINLNSASLKDLPDGFCNLSTLTELDMTDCHRLEKLPERFGEVTSLRKLIMTSCCSLQKLPESFNQLKYLEHLDLSACSTLEELCEEFEGLSLLRVLSLNDCDKLKKLPEDFQCLTSLEVLDVENCHKLEGKWIDSMLKMEKLQILRIAGSKLLEERCEKIQAQQCNQSWSCAVYTEQGLSNEENLLKQLQSKFDSMLTNGEGEPLNISGLPLNTLLLVMFDGGQDFDLDFPLPLLEESIDDIQTHFEMVYFGNHWDQLPKKVADRILGHAPANGDAKALFQKLLPLVTSYSMDIDWLLSSSFQMTAEIVSGEKGDKYLSRWKYLKFDPDEEDFVVTKCGRYLKLKQLAERGGGGLIALLRELFAGGEEKSSLSFLKNKDGESTKVGVDELQGKTILLDIRPANICFDIPLHALVEMYNMEKEKFGFEIITVPIMQDDTTLDVSEKFSREVPWLVLQTPWQLTNATKYFLVNNWHGQWNQGWDSWYPNRMRIIKSDGAIAPYRNPGVLRMVNTWGAAAYPFTAEKEEELIQKEETQMEAMSDAMFLFQHLERVAEQLREATGQQKMIWLCCCHQKEFTNSMKDVLTGLSDIIYIIYIPYFQKGGEQWVDFTLTIGQLYTTLESSTMSAAEMAKMLWLSLSEYEAIRFWARIYSLKELISFKYQFLFHYDPDSWMFIMDEDGNLITTKGKEFVKLLSEKYSDDRVKELMQQLLEGGQTSRKKTLLELVEML